MTFESFYDANWLTMGDYFRVHRRRFLHTWAFVEHLSLPSHGTALDVGGVGPLSQYLQKTREWSILQSESDLRQSLDFDSDLFDLILCTETIEHIKDVESSRITDLEAFNYSGVLHMLMELKRTMKENGHLVITTPNASSYITLHKWIVGEVLLMDPEHVREFSVADLRRIARRCGLIEKRLSVTNSWAENFGGHVLEVQKRLEGLIMEVGVDRRDNIIAAFVK